MLVLDQYEFLELRVIKFHHLLMRGYLQNASACFRHPFNPPYDIDVFGKCHEMHLVTWITAETLSRVIWKTQKIRKTRKTLKPYKQELVLPFKILDFQRMELSEERSLKRRRRSYMSRSY